MADAENLAITKAVDQILELIREDIAASQKLRQELRPESGSILKHVGLILPVLAAIAALVLWSGNGVQSAHEAKMAAQANAVKLAELDKALGVSQAEARDARIMAAAAAARAAELDREVAVLRERMSRRDR